MSSYVNQRCATLVLRTIDATNRGTNDTEFLSNTQRGTYWEWNGINLANVLADMRLKNNKFNIILVSCQQGTYAQNTSGIGSVGLDNVFNFRLGGLSFLNGEYDVKLDKQSNSQIIGGITLNTANNGSQQIIVYNTQMNTFQIGNDIVNLRISYEKIQNKLAPVVNAGASLLLPSGASGATFPEMLWIFKIFAVDEEIIDTRVREYKQETRIKLNN